MLLKTAASVASQRIRNGKTGLSAELQPVGEVLRWC